MTQCISELHEGWILSIVDIPKTILCPTFLKKDRAVMTWLRHETNIIL